MQLRIVHDCLPCGVEVCEVRLKVLAQDGVVSLTLSEPLSVDAVLVLHVVGVSGEVQHRTALFRRDLEAGAEELRSGGEGQLEALLREREATRRQGPRLHQVVPRVGVDLDRLIHKGCEEPPQGVVRRELLPGGRDHEVRDLEVHAVKVVDEGHQDRQRGAEAEFCFRPRGVGGARDRLHILAIPARGAEPAVHDLHGAEAGVEVGVAAVPSEARAHRDARQRVCPNDVVAGATLDLHLDAVRAEAVQAEAGERLVAVLVRPILVDRGIEVAHLLHDILHWVLVGFKCVEVVDLRQVEEVLLHPSREAGTTRKGPRAPSGRVELLLPLLGNLDLQGQVNMIFCEWALRPKMIKVDDFTPILPDHDQIVTHALDAQVHHPRVEVRHPIKWRTSPEVREAPKTARSRQAHEDKARNNSNEEESKRYEA
mmetsp:Transcript_19501/g.56717  ORF Transcript_19501/g.56717 Transcript_19501/m.56717 type:complete len:426 (+) Transcript_19501:626-1903(+)